MSKLVKLVLILSLFGYAYSQIKMDSETRKVMLKLLDVVCEPQKLESSKSQIVARCESNVSRMFRMAYGGCVRQILGIRDMTLPFICYRTFPNGDKLKDCMESRGRIASKLGIDVEAMRNKVLNSYADCMRPLLPPE